MYMMERYMLPQDFDDKIKMPDFSRRTLKVLNDVSAYGLDEDDVPDDFRCPVSRDIMTDPVLALDGHTYDRTSISTWFQTKSTSPSTNETLQSKILIPNHNMKSQIERFAQEVRAKKWGKDKTAAAAATEKLMREEGERQKKLLEAEVEKEVEISLDQKLLEEVLIQMQKEIVRKIKLDGRLERRERRRSLGYDSDSSTDSESSDESSEDESDEDGDGKTADDKEAEATDDVKDEDEENENEKFFWQYQHPKTKKWMDYNEIENFRINKAYENQSTQVNLMAITGFSGGMAGIVFWVKGRGFGRTHGLDYTVDVRQLRMIHAGGTRQTVKYKLKLRRINESKKAKEKLREEKRKKRRKHSVDLNLETLPAIEKEFREIIGRKYRSPAIAFHELRSTVSSNSSRSHQRHRYNHPLSAAVRVIGESEPEYLTRSDFKRMLTYIGMRLSEKERKALRRKIDTKNTKQVSRQDFVCYLNSATVTTSPMYDAYAIAEARMFSRPGMNRAPPSLPADFTMDTVSHPVVGGGGSRYAHPQRSYSVRNYQDMPLPTSQISYSPRNYQDMPMPVSPRYSAPRNDAAVWEPQLRQLNDMGLVDRERNLELLRQHRGDMNEVCATLFGERMARGR